MLQCACPTKAPLKNEKATSESSSLEQVVSMLERVLSTPGSLHKALQASLNILVMPFSLLIL